MKQTFYAVAVLAAALAGGTVLTPPAAQPASKAGIKNVVLVHGAFADGSGWAAVAAILTKDGFTVSVAQPPETSYADDIKYTRAAIDAMDGPVILVGHSYGGSIITRRATIRRFQDWSISLPSPSMRVRAARRSSRLCRKRPRRSRRIAAATGG